ncbi:hypothetical protein HYX10_01930 [Candidatus Woesearchaeota archaeon]|nr:hypothetical protein [Candidatus Woesearchaeota archaeon]
MNNKPIYVTFGDKKIESEFEILKEGKFEDKQLYGFIDRAIKYSDGIAAIEAIFTADNRMYGGLTRFILKKITPLGINIVENKPEFKRNFGFEVNVGLNPSVKLSWGASEK